MIPSKMYGRGALRTRLSWLAVAAITFTLALPSLAVQGTKLPIEGTEFYKLNFGEGLTTENDKCPVRKIRLGERMPPVLVNGKAIGFC